MARSAVAIKYAEDEDFVYYQFFEQVGKEELGRFKVYKSITNIKDIENHKNISQMFETIALTENSMSKSWSPLAKGAVYRACRKNGVLPDIAHHN